MAETPARAKAVIDLAALRDNYAKVRACCPTAAVLPVVKANAYGHGLEAVAGALARCAVRPAGFGVATVDEALQVMRLMADMGVDIPAVVFGGCADDAELAACLGAGAEPVIHNMAQARALRRALGAGKLVAKLQGKAQSKTQNARARKPRVWLKVNTGMNRLGLATEQAPAAYAELHAHAGALDIVLMSHFACADEGAANVRAQIQAERFAAMRERLGKIAAAEPPASLAASAAIMAMPGSAYDYVRPGIMLYGGSPLQGKTGPEVGLKPVMTLRSRLIAAHTVRAGESIGYGATYTCKRDTRVGVVSFGYADGYPRSAPTGAPVLVHCGGGDKPAQLLGRVSMDLITIDLTAAPDAKAGDTVTLWGAGLPADDIAAHAGTIAYELFCRVGRRVAFEYRG